MDANTQAIVELAWSRVLGLGDDELAASDGQRVLREHPSTLMFVQLWQHRVLLGPPALLDRARSLSDAELADGPTLLALSATDPQPSTSARLVGHAILAFADAYLDFPELKTTEVTDEPHAITDLERACPPDDVAEVGLSELGWAIALLGADDTLLGGAGFEEWEHILGHVGVLTPPSHRRTGYGRIAAGIATNEALDRGLVPQWRARADNIASLRLAQRLGYRRVGSQTTVAW